MTGTGRLTGELGLRTRRLVYGEPTEAELAAELALMTRVDRAHLVMLAEQQLIPATTAALLLGCIDELAGTRFGALRSRPAPRGLYLMYEGYLIERLGPEVGGVLHSGRSRNDLKATITLLRLREWLGEFAEQAVRLEAILLSRARAHAGVVMPAYTHFQAAMPVSYGYYLLGVALAVGREIDALAAASSGLGACPLGAAAVAGTDLPINPERAALLLGFTTAAPHALDAVASRDVPLRVLACAASLAVVLSRLGTDLQLWSTAEFGFVEFPDRLVGGSSAMPQKRNAFLLEHVKAKAGHVTGAWAAAAGMMTAAPFTNSIEVGTEAMAAIWPGLDAARQSVLLSPGARQRGQARPRPDAAARGRVVHRGDVAGQPAGPAGRPVPDRAPDGGRGRPAGAGGRLDRAGGLRAARLAGRDRGVWPGPGGPDARARARRRPRSVRRRVR